MESAADVNAKLSINGHGAHIELQIDKIKRIINI
jgi:hypothetical protein